MVVRFTPKNKEGGGTLVSDATENQSASLTQNSSSFPSQNPQEIPIQEVWQRYEKTLGGGQGLECSQENYARMMGLTRFSSLPEKTIDLQETSLGASFIFLAALGMVRFWAKPEGSDNGNRHFEAKVLFPNLNELTLPLTVDSERNIEIRNGGQGLYTDHNRGENKRVRIFKVAGFSARIAVDFQDGDPPLILDLAIQEPKHGDFGGYRLVLAPNQPRYEGNSDKFNQRKQGSPPLTLRHIEKVSERGVRGNRGGIKKYQLHLSNGDLIELEIYTDHRTHGSFRAHAANLHRLSDKDPENFSRLTVQGQGNGPGEIYIYGEGYELKLDVRPPSGSSGSEIEFPSALRVIAAPDQVFATPKQPVVLPKGTPQVEPNKGIWLRPDPATARILNNPPWEKKGAELKFIGEIGGLKVTEGAPLTIEGDFIEGQFQPKLEMGKENTLVVFPEGHFNPLQVTLRITEGGFILQVPLPDGGSLDAEQTNLGKVFGLSHDPAQMRGKLIELYEKKPLSDLGITYGSQWKELSKNLRPYQELKQLFSWDAVAWSDQDVLTVNENNPDVYKIKLKEGRELILHRSFDGEHQLDYQLLPKTSDGSQVSILIQDNKIEGFLLDKGRENQTLIKPWMGNLTRIDNVPNFWDELNSPRNLNVIFKEGAKTSFTYLGRGPKNTQDLERLGGGVLTGVERNGVETMVFEWGRGDGLRVHLPEGVHWEEGLLALDLDPIHSANKEFELEEIDPQGKVLRRGAITAQGGDWIVNLEGKPLGALRLALETSNPIGPAMSIIPMDVVQRVVTERPPSIPPAPGEAPPPPTAPSVSPTFRPRFPWEEGTFLLPSEKTRRLMRAPFHPAERPKEGAKAQFEFYGDPQSPEGNEFRARVILASMSRFGKDSRKFYGWMLKMDMTFRDGQWIPDTDGKLEVSRRFPEMDGEHLVGNFQQLGLGGTFPIRLAKDGNNWGIRVGPGNEIVQPFRALLKEVDQIAFSPDFGLSLGPPKKDALDQLTKLELFTRVNLHDYAPPPPSPMLVHALVGEDLSGRLTPEFGDPIYRAHLEINHHDSIIEFSPGYSDKLPDVRFTQFRVYDGNGFHWRLVFQHWNGHASLVGAEALGENLNLKDLPVETLADGSQRVSGIIPAKHLFMKSDPNARGIPFQVTWSLDEGKFILNEVQIYDNKNRLEGLTFQGGLWKKEDVFTPRNGSELVVKVTRVEGREKGGRVTPDAPPPPKDGPAVMVPALAKNLANGLDAKGNPIKDIISVDYQMNLGKNEIRQYRLQLRYNDREMTYEPTHSSGSILVQVDGEAVPVDCQLTQTGRNWRLTFPDKSQAYFGNFYMNPSEDGGRPVPILWLSAGRDPHRRQVNHFLEEQDLAPGIVHEMELDKGSTEAFEVKINTKDASYQAHLRVVPAPGPKYFVVPTGPALKMANGQSQPVAVNYFHAYRGAPAVLEFDGRAYELEINDRGVYGMELALRRTHPGASGVYSVERARSHVMLQPEDQSAFLFLDLNDTKMVEEIKKASESKDKILRRTLWDGISREPFEFVFRVDLDRMGRSRLRLQGIAQLTKDGPQMISQQVLEVSGKVFVRTVDGHYLSFSSYPAFYLQVSSHGRSLQEDLVKRTWEEMSPDEDIFSPRPQSMTDPTRPDTYYVTRDNRLQAREIMAEKFGIESALIWDMDKIMPNGMAINPMEWDPNLPSRRVHERGPLRIEYDLHWDSHPQNVRVTYYGENIPFDLVKIEGRPFMLLKGPLFGVTFYWDRVRRGIQTPREISHPALREQLDRDRGIRPLPRPTFHKDHRGNKYKYPEVEGALKEALGKQVARSRLWRLEQNGVLPPDREIQDKIADFLIPDQENFGQGNRPKLLEALEKISSSPSYQSVVSRLIEGIGEGTLQRKDFHETILAWEKYDAALGEAGEYKALEDFVARLNEVGDKGTKEEPREKPRPPISVQPAPLTPGHEALTQSSANLRKFLEKIGLDQKEIKNIKEGDLSETIIARMKIMGRENPNPDLLLELEAFNGAMEENPGLKPHRDEILLYVVWDRIEKGNRGGQCQPLDAVVDDFWNRKRTESIRIARSAMAARTIETKQEVAEEARRSSEERAGKRR